MVSRPAKIPIFAHYSTNICNVKSNYGVTYEVSNLKWYLHIIVCIPGVDREAITKEMEQLITVCIDTLLVVSGYS